MATATELVNDAQSYSDSRKNDVQAFINTLADAANINYQNVIDELFVQHPPLNVVEDMLDNIAGRFPEPPTVLVPNFAVPAVPDIAFTAIESARDVIADSVKALETLRHAPRPTVSQSTAEQAWIAAEREFFADPRNDVFASSPELFLALDEAALDAVHDLVPIWRFCMERARPSAGEHGGRGRRRSNEPGEAALIDIEPLTPGHLADSLEPPLNAAGAAVLEARKGLGRAILRARYAGGARAAVDDVHADLSAAEMALVEREAVQASIVTFALDFEDSGRTARRSESRQQRQQDVAAFEEALQRFTADRTLARSRTRLKEAADEICALAQQASQMSRFREALRRDSLYADIAWRY